MTDIDWQAVEWVCEEGTPLKLKPDEKRAVVRQLIGRMLTDNEHHFATNKLTSTEVARRLITTERSVERLKAELVGAVEADCPVCRHSMWILRGKVLPHPDKLLRDCTMTGRQVLHGLAAERPDLYGWQLERTLA